MFKHRVRKKNTKKYIVSNYLCFDTSSALLRGSSFKQLGISKNGKQKNYVINPFFFGLKISFDIFINRLLSYEYDKDLEDGLVKILSDKYGIEFLEIYQYVSDVCKKAANEGRKKGDKKDETFISGVQSISGINDKNIFYSFIYESAMLTATAHAKIFRDQ